MFFIQKRFNKFIYGINTIIKCGAWQPVKFQLVSRSWTMSDATLYDCINTIYQFIKTFLDKKCLFLRNMEPLNILLVNILDPD